jgi:hypothetical protein
MDFPELGLSSQVQSCTLTKLSPRNGIGSRHRLYAALSGLSLKVKKSDKVEAQASYAAAVLTVKIRQPSHEFTFGVGMSFIPYPLVLTPVV